MLWRQVGRGIEARPELRRSHRVLLRAIAARPGFGTVLYSDLTGFKVSQVARLLRELAMMGGIVDRGPANNRSIYATPAAVLRLAEYEGSI